MAIQNMLAQWASLLAGTGQTALKLAVWLLIAMFIMIPLERVAGEKSRKIIRAGFLQDLLYYFFSGMAPAFLLVVFYALVVHVFRTILPAEWFEFVRGLPHWLRILAVVIVGDIGYYWAHRWAHKIPALWKIHVIHHSSVELDWLVATRAHPLEIAYTRGLSFIPVFALGLIDVSGGTGDTALLLLVVFNTFWGFFIHANVDFRFGWLEKLISTPRFHHWHHADDQPEVRNKNYAALFPFIDMIFGTYYLPPETFPAVYGTETVIPAGFLRQLAYPIWPSRAPD
jgi:sterol desaturase/sphingolipid hydroxylase (fatty acid hydroxylase superfamily)